MGSQLYYVIDKSTRATGQGGDHMTLACRTVHRLRVESHERVSDSEAEKADAVVEAPRPAGRRINGGGGGGEGVEIRVRFVGGGDDERL
jgi:hypothetical protein